MSTKPSGLLNNVLQSVFFKRAAKQAPAYIKNADGILKLLKTALSKTQSMGVGGVVDSVRENVVLMGQMLKAYAAGDFKLEMATLVKLVSVLLYFISPIDLLPDFLPMLGFTDDLALLAWVIGSLDSELERFKTFQRHNHFRSF
jgi:uncharacterized membrane protein YkvA (DUF1232 family)